jgi:hypothetical protein
MSTHAQIIVTDGQDQQWFYRHSDGYPNGTLPTLELFLNKVRKKEIRNNTEQACGWLVIIGHAEYAEARAKYAESMGWKVGAYEPCPPVEHGDIEYLYTVDLRTCTVTYVER